MSVAGAPTAGFDRPYVISWNLTYRCNLACEHCYLDAGSRPQVSDETFSDRSELTTEQCFRVVDQIADFAPECLTILTGGEPLLRRDILEIVQYAAGRGLWVVVGTNGVKITENVATLLAKAGARGLSLSLDALDAATHDRFRGVRGAFDNTVEGAGILNRAGLPFIVQTTAGAHNRDRLEAIAEFAYTKLQAKVWNLYFLVPTGRGQFVSDMSPAAYDEVLASLYRIQRSYAGRMIVNAKCAPHYIKTVLEAAQDSTALPGSAFPASPGTETTLRDAARTDSTESDATSADGGLAAIRTYTGGAGGCPAGTHYMGIRPNGDVTPCPYLPQFAGNLKDEPLEAIWSASDLFVQIRDRNSLGGRCGACELSSRCGGCRARAFGMTGDLMAEDPLCTHEPGRFAGSPLLDSRIPKSVSYGEPAVRTIAWDDDAKARIDRIPAFVRGMVLRAVEDSCRKSGIFQVTLEELERLRSRMPTSKLFRRP